MILVSFFCFFFFPLLLVSPRRLGWTALLAYSLLRQNLLSLIMKNRCLQIHSLCNANNYNGRMNSDILTLKRPRSLPPVWLSPASLQQQNPPLSPAVVEQTHASVVLLRSLKEQRTLHFVPCLSSNTRSCSCAALYPSWWRIVFVAVEHHLAITTPSNVLIDHGNAFCHWHYMRVCMR